MQEYLKCLRDMAIMKGLNEVEVRVSTPRKPAPKAGFVASGVKIKSKSLKSQRQTSVVEQKQTKKPPIWGAFLCLNLSSH